MFTVKRRICNATYCYNWETLAKGIKDIKTANYVLEEWAEKGRKSHLKHTYAIFEDDAIVPIRKIEV